MSSSKTQTTQVPAGDGSPPAATSRAPERPFETLDLLPDIILPNENADLVQVSIDMSGKHLLLLLCPDLATAAGREQIEGFAHAFEVLAPLAHVFVVTTSTPEENKAALEKLPLPFPVLSDHQRQVARGLAVEHNLSAAPLKDDGLLTVVFADPNRRILQIDRNIREVGAAEAALHFLRGLPRKPPRFLGGFAPVLYVPKVLEPSFCEELVASFEAGEPEEGRAYSQGGAAGEGGYVVDPTIKVRRDFYVTDPNLTERLRWRVVRRVKPEILKAFTRDISGIEEFKVVCYDGSRGGHFRPHRDNVTKKNAHRRFAMTLNLNSGFKGGGLRFPEYGSDLYVPEAGDAVVFSCSLMHEATPVTDGKRYVLLSFMYDEESRQWSQQFRR
jgi:peroxiredoxin/predicted 2-oxoglutarate/Fe(II)-dependent dioxygenase YbiX